VKKHVCNLPLDVSAHIGDSDNNVIDVMVVFQSCGFVDVDTHVLTPGKKIASTPSNNQFRSQVENDVVSLCCSFYQSDFDLVFLFPFALSANTCFGPNDGYSGCFGPGGAAMSKLGKAVRDFLNADPLVSGPVKAMYGETMNSWCVGSVTGMDYIFFGLGSFNEEVGGWDVGSVTTMKAMVSSFSIV
jgi:Mycoplasma protein of unknown function, DUF285